MKSFRVLVAVCGLLLCSLSAAEAGDQTPCRNCNNSVKQVTMSNVNGKSNGTSNGNGNGTSSGNGTSNGRSSGRVFGVFQTRSRADMRDSWYHTHPKWSAGRKATGAAYR